MAGVACAAAALFVLGVGLTASPPPLNQDSHAWLSISQALNQSMCGTLAVGRDPMAVPRHLHSHPWLRTEPLGRVAALVAGSEAAYCESLTLPYLNNENSLMLLMRAGLWLRPSASLDTLWYGLASARLILLLLFTWIAVRLGANVLVAAAFVLIVQETVAAQSGFAYSLYPFVLPFTLALSAAFAALLRAYPRMSPWRHVFLTGAMGVFVGFGGNLRSTYLPIYALFFATYLLCACWMDRRQRSAPRGAWLGVAALTFTVGLVGFNTVVIRPLEPARNQQNYAHHPIAHPLVLSLALPPNAFATRLGIRWEDTAGLELARRVDPHVKYLGPTYEAALYELYLRLWKSHTSEMLEVYRLKFWTAGMDMLATVRPGNSPWRLAGTLVAPWSRLPAGWGLLLILGLGTILSLSMMTRTGSAYGFLLALVCSGGLFVQAESIAIMPAFMPMYHATLVFALCVASIVIMESAVQTLLKIVIKGSWRIDASGILVAASPPLILSLLFAGTPDVWAFVNLTRAVLWALVAAIGFIGFRLYVGVTSATLGTWVVFFCAGPWAGASLVALLGVIALWAALVTTGHLLCNAQEAPTLTTAAGVGGALGFATGLNAVATPLAAWTVPWLLCSRWPARTVIRFASALALLGAMFGGAWTTGGGGETAGVVAPQAQMAGLQRNERDSASTISGILAVMGQPPVLAFPSLGSRPAHPPSWLQRLTVALPIGALVGGLIAFVAVFRFSARIALACLLLAACLLFGRSGTLQASDLLCRAALQVGAVLGGVRAAHFFGTQKRERMARREIKETADG